MAITDPVVKAEFDKFESQLARCIEHYRTELQYIRAGRANPNILNKIFVDYYGTSTPLNQMANISVPDARTLLISLWDVSALKDVRKALLASDLGINPVDDGKVIRLSFPALTEEKRLELKKQIKKMAEESKVVLRNERRDIMDVLKKFKKDSAITEDDFSDYDKEVMKLLEKALAVIDSLLAEKEKELMEI